MQLGCTSGLVYRVVPDSGVGCGRKRAEQLLSIKQLHIYVLYKFVGNVCSSYSIAHNIVLHQPSISCISYNIVAAHPDDASQFRTAS